MKRLKFVWAIFFCFTPLLTFSQQTDTIFYDFRFSQIEASSISDASIYEVRNFNKKGRVRGNSKLYNSSGRSLGSLPYKKGLKSGNFSLHLDSLILHGQYDNDVRSGFWSADYTNDKPAYVEEYDKNGALVERVFSIKNKPKEPVGDYFIVTEEQPSFPGGGSGWGRFLRKTLRYPSGALRNKIQGTVHVTFYVLPDGRAVGPRVIESPDKSLSKEALRVMSKSPNWISGKVNGEKALSKMTVQIFFRLR